MRPDLFLRTARRADAAALARLRATSLREQRLLAPDDVAFEPAACAELAALFDDGRLAAWVAVAGGRAIGSACVVFWQRLPYAGTSLHAELCGVFVEAPYRRRGLARELCGEAIASARGRSVRKIVVHSTPVARALYASLGFTGREELTLDVSGSRRDARLA